MHVCALKRRINVAVSSRICSYSFVVVYMFDCILSCFVVYVSLHVPLICLTENRKPQVRVGVWDPPYLRAALVLEMLAGAGNNRGRESKKR